MLSEFDMNPGLILLSTGMINSLLNLVIIFNKVN